MTAFPRRRRPLNDADAARLLHGTPVDHRPDLAGAAAFAGRLRAVSQDAPAPTAALAALLAEGFDPATVTPTAQAPASAPRRRTLAYGLLRLAGLSLAVKVATGTGVAVAAVATAGTAGVLPGPVQDRLDRIVDAVTPSGDQAPGDRQGPPELPLPVPTASAPATAPVKPSSAPAPRPTAVPAPRATAVSPPPPASGPPSSRPTPPRATPAAERPSKRPAGPPSARPTPSRAAAPAPAARPTGGPAVELPAPARR